MTTASASIPASASIAELSSIHEDIHTKLDVFIKNRKIPNIIFYGPRGSGKTFILNRFISSVYGGDKTAIKNYVMRANCAHGKGIRFIREELKFFAKTNIDLKEGAIFKSVILTNADKLTIDAQSALRRCIELFSYSTRFFIVVENKDSLLKPILSRFCDIYVPQPIIMGCGGIGTPVNLHSYRANMVCDTSKIERLRDKSLGELIKIHPDYLTTSDKLDQVTATPTPTATPTSSEYKSIVDLSVVLYEQGYCGLDVIEFVRNHSQMNEIKKYELLIMFDKVRKEFRNEKLLLLFILHFIVFRCNRSLENISFM
jgi:GTPase SAR1 family protein